MSLPSSLGLLLGLTLALAAPLSTPLAREPAVRIGVVVAQQGSVTAADADSLRALYNGAPVQLGDLIITQAGARVEIALLTGSTIVVGGGSRVALSVFTDRPARAWSFIAELTRGIVRSVIGTPAPERFEIRARSAVAAARSTDFIVIQEPEGPITSVLGVEGKVAVQRLDGQADERSVHLGPGDGVDQNDGAPLTMKKWGEARVAATLARVPLSRASPPTPQ